MNAPTPIALVLAVCALSTDVASAAPYSVVDLGSLGGPTYVYALDGAGRAGGTSLNNAFSFRAVVWSHGLAEAGPTPGYSQSVVFAFDATGRAVVHAYNLGALTSRAFALDPGGPVDLGAFAPRAANGAGDIVGAVRVALPTGWTAEHAARLRAGSLVDLGTLGGSSSRALGLAEDGRVVGSAQIAGDGASHACLWREGVAHDLGTLGGRLSQAYDANSSGAVVGYSEIPGGVVRACLFRVDALDNVLSRTNLGSLAPAESSVAYAVNSAGDIVGVSGIRAFVRPAAGGQMVDLNTLIAPGSGWTLEVATAINDAGRIIGWGQHNGHPAAFELLVCPSDLSGDGLVNSADLALLLGSWGGAGAADINADGLVDSQDLALLLGSWGACQ